MADAANGEPAASAASALANEDESGRVITESEAELETEQETEQEDAKDDVIEDDEGVISSFPFSLRGLILADLLNDYPLDVEVSFLSFFSFPWAGV